VINTNFVLSIAVCKLLQIIVHVCIF